MKSMSTSRMQQAGLDPVRDDTPKTEVEYAERRLPDRTYISKTFTERFGRDKGKPARYIWKVFDEEEASEEDDWDRETHVIRQSEAGRKQIQFIVARKAGAIRKIKIQDVSASASQDTLRSILTLNREQSAKLIDLIKALDSIPVEGSDTTRIDDNVLHMALSDPEAVRRMYETETGKQQLIEAIQSDADARDIAALQHRREVVETMQSWLDNDEVFDKASNTAGGPEYAWQKLLEDNPWVLGVGLSGRLLTSWSADKLEQTSTGKDFTHVGKRADALMRTNGLIRSIVFAEIKHHRTDLLAAVHYRSGCWPASTELSGAITQAQRTVQLAMEHLRYKIEDQADDGSDLGTFTYMVQPRSYLIIGNLKQLIGKSGGSFQDKVASFELIRSHLTRPEIITFDELVARAQWAIDLASSTTS